MFSGIIAAVNDFSIPIDRVVGTSSGALAAALFASGLDSFQIATGESRRWEENVKMEMKERKRERE